MKHPIITALAMILLCGGCAAPDATTIFGDPCEALSAKQLSYLTGFSRTALKKNAVKYKFTREELDIVKNSEPRLRTEYRGNRYGTLFVLWDTPKRILGMRFEGKLDIEVPSCAMIIGSTDGSDVGAIQPDKTRRGR